jgi:stress-induced morphogen
MPIDADTIRSRILTALPGAEVAVRDSTGTGDHFQATVVSESFAGKLLIDRHRLVYAALGEAMKGDIHALALDTLTPDERARRGGK